MSWPSPSARTKNWGTEILTDADQEGQLDILHNYLNDSLNGASGHGHTGGTADGRKIDLATSVLISSQAQGDILYASSSTVFSKLGAGTAGQSLITGGSGANPSWGVPQFLPQNIQVFTSSGTWTKPANVTQVYVKVIGAGGNGGTGSANGGGGGGGGGYAEGIIAVTGNVTVTIGATNSFAGTTTIQSTAGSNGTSGSGGAGGAGGVGSNGTLNLTGATGQGGQSSGTNTYGGGSGGGSAFGPGGGGGAALGGSGSNGGKYGGGGGAGGNSNGTAGNGDAGAVIVYY